LRAAGPRRRAGASSSVGPPARAFLEQQAAAVHGSFRDMLRAAESSPRAPLQMAGLAMRRAARTCAAASTQTAPPAPRTHGARYRFVAYAPGDPAADVPPFTFLAAHARPLGVGLVGTRKLMNADPKLNRERAALGLRARRPHHLVGERLLLAADEELAPPPQHAFAPVEPIACPFDEHAPLPRLSLSWSGRPRLRGLRQHRARRDARLARAASRVRDPAGLGRARRVRCRSA
jgi:hypothetical protein